MGEVTRFEIGAEVYCHDGPCGDLRRVVLDPVARAVTHLVVQPQGGWGLGRLVPVGLVEASGAQIQLRCTRADFERLETADEMQFLPESDGGLGYEAGQTLSWPHFGMDLRRLGGQEGIGGNAAEPVAHDKVPLGEVEIRRGDHVHALDGEIGQVHGLVIDPRDHHVTHVLLQEGHLWGRKEVAIPLSAVRTVDDGIQLTIAKDEVQDLPAVDLDHGPLN